MVDRLTSDMPAGSYAVGEHVRHPGRGVDRRVHGVRRTAQGEFLQFAPDGPWLPTEGFERREGERPLPRPR